MPTYNWSCSGCEKEEEAYVPSWKDERPCTVCGTKMEKVWSITKRSGTQIYPYVTRNILPDGSPVEVTGPGHEAELCKRYGVVKRDDVAWLEESSERYDWRTKRMVRKEGSGRGMPGQWI